MRMEAAVLAAQKHRRMQAEQALQSAAALAASLNPYGVLARGYAIAQKNGQVKTVEQLRPGDQITLQGAYAQADCTVQAVRSTTKQLGSDAQ